MAESGLGLSRAGRQWRSRLPTLAFVAVEKLSAGLWACCGWVWRRARRGRRQARFSARDHRPEAWPAPRHGIARGRFDGVFHVSTAVITTVTSHAQNAVVLMMMTPGRAGFPQGRGGRSGTGLFRREEKG
jgi:hypothetical protein